MVVVVVTFAQTDNIVEIAEVSVQVMEDPDNAKPAFKEPYFEVYNSYKEIDVCIVRTKNTDYYKTRYALARYSTGKMLIPALFHDFSEDADVFSAKINNNYGLLDKDGKVLAPFIYSYLNSFSLDGETFYRVKKATNSALSTRKTTLCYHLNTINLKYIQTDK